MLTRITQIVEGLGGIFGIRAGTEEPFYLCEGRIGRAEIRRYGPRIAAQTAVTGDGQDARSAGFRRLAGYIFGGNDRADKIAMTAPVAQSGTDSGSVIRFYMPSKWSLDTLPEPSDSSITVVEVPAARYAVLTFSGDRDRAAVAAKSAELLRELQGSDVTVEGDPVAWFYDPPWTLPFRRRNEVAVLLGP
ncbi:SOUL family heme-binding protein [Mycobacterium sp. NPDC003323]